MLEDRRLVSLERAEYGYRRGFTLGPVDLELAHGVTALIGPNGAGKTTLIKLLTATNLPRRGVLRHRGTPVHRGRSVDELRRDLGHLPQDPHWDGAWRVADYLDYAGRAFGVPRDAVADRRRAALDAVGMVDCADRRLGQLSGGQRQRVHLASVLVHEPEVLVLDEPTVGLDPAERIRFRRILKREATRRAILVSTHLMDDVALAADLVVILDDGRVRWRGTVDELAHLGATADNDGASAVERGYLEVLTR